MTLLFRKIVLLGILAAILPCVRSFAQDDPNIEEGMKPYGDFHGGNIDAVNLGTGGLTFAIDLWDFPERGSVKMPLTLRYNSKLWSNIVLCGGVLCGPEWVYGSPSGINLPGQPIVEADPSSPVQPGTSPIYATLGSFSVGDCMYRSYLIVPGQPPSGGVIDCNALSSDGATHVAGRLSSQPTNLTAFETIDDSAIYVLPEQYLDPITNTLYLVPIALDRNGLATLYLQANDPDGNDVSVSGQYITDTRGVTLPLMKQVSNYANCAGPLPIASATTWSPAGVGGVTSTFTFCYASVQLRPNFPNLPGATIAPYPYTSNTLLLQSIDLPTHDKWIFNYDSYADVTEIVFPTGATLSYQWDTFPLCSMASMPNPEQAMQNLIAAGWTPESRFVTSRTLDANDGTGPHQWTYTWSPELTTPTSRSFQVTVNDPQGNDTVHTETGLSNSCSFYETKEQIYQGAASDLNNVPLQTTVTNYHSILSPANNSNWMTLGIIDAAEVYPTDVTISIPSNAGTLVKRIERDYDQGLPYYVVNWDETISGPYTTTYGTVSAERDYDYGVGTWGKLLRQKAITYMRDVNSAYQYRPDLVYSEQILDGNNVPQSHVQYGYDETPILAAGITTNHNTPYSANGVTFASIPRGHQTSETKMADSSGKTIQSCKTYYDTGMLATSTDWTSSAPNCAGANITSYSYDKAYVGAFRTQTQKPTAANGQVHIVSGTYDFNTGKLTSFTDENNVVSQYYYNDPLARMTKADRATGTAAETTTTFSYPNLLEIESTADQSSLGDGRMHKTSIYDGVGRILHSETTSDPSGVLYTDTTYDSLGRIYSVSNPYRTKSDPTYGVTYSIYDAIGRKVVQTNPDNTTNIWCFNGVGVVKAQNNCFANIAGYGEWIDREDENMNDLQTTADALGRMTTVTEPSGTAVPNGVVHAPSLTTFYTYDVNNNLLSVNQTGNGSTDTARKRSFTYDYLSRLVCASNPETSYGVCPASSTSPNVPGTTVYSYDANGNLYTKTDARGLTIGYCYDVLNRNTYKFYTGSFSCTNPTGYAASFSYDLSSVSGAQYTIGRLTDELSYAGKTLAAERQPYAYDAMGRLLKENQCILGSCSSTAFHPSYQYDLTGNQTSVTDGTTPIPSGSTLTLTSSYDGSGRLQTVTSNWIDATHPAPLFSPPSGQPTTCPNSTTAQYAPFGGLTNVVLGNDLLLNRTYDIRQREACEIDSQF